MLYKLDTEEAIVKIIRVCGENNNPIGFFREALHSHGNSCDFEELQKAGLIKILNKKGTIGYYSAWMQITTKAKNLYNKVKLNYRWNY